MGKKKVVQEEEEEAGEEEDEEVIPPPASGKSKKGAAKNNNKKKKKKQQEEPEEEEEEEENKEEYDDQELDDYFDIEAPVLEKDIKYPEWMSIPYVSGVQVKEKATKGDANKMMVDFQQTLNGKKGFPTWTTPVLRVVGGFVGAGGFVGTEYNEPDKLKTQDSKETLTLSLTYDESKIPEELRETEWAIQSKEQLPAFLKAMQFFIKQSIMAMALDPKCKPKIKESIKKEIREKREKVGKEELIRRYYKRLKADGNYFVSYNKEEARWEMKVSRKVFKKGNNIEIFDVLRSIPSLPQIPDPIKAQYMRLADSDKKSTWLSRWLLKTCNTDIERFTRESMMEDPDLLHLYNAVKHQMVMRPCKILQTNEEKTGWKEVKELEKEQRKKKVIRPGAFVKLKVFTRTYINNQSPNDVDNPAKDNSGMFGVKGGYNHSIVSIVQAPEVGDIDFDFVGGGTDYVSKVAKKEASGDLFSDDEDQEQLKLPGVVRDAIAKEKKIKDAKNSKKKKSNKNVEDIDIETNDDDQDDLMSSDNENGEDDDDDGLSDTERKERAIASKKRANGNASNKKKGGKKKNMEEEEEEDEGIEQIIVKTVKKRGREQEADDDVDEPVEPSRKRQRKEIELEFDDI